MLAGETEERLEGRHRGSSPVETEHVFAQVWQMRGTHPVMGSRQPALEIREHPMHAREQRAGVCRPSLRPAPVVIALGREGTIAAPAVGMDDAAGSNRRFEESNQRCGGQILDDAEPDSTGALTADLNSTDYDRFGTVAQTPSSAPDFHPAHVGLIDLHLAADAISFRANHRPSQLLQQAPGGFVALEAELALQLNGRDTRRVGADQVGRRKPIPNGQARAMEHRAGRDRTLIIAFLALKDRT